MLPGAHFSVSTVQGSCPLRGVPGVLLPRVLSPPVGQPLSLSSSHLSAAEALSRALDGVPRGAAQWGQTWLHAELSRVGSPGVPRSKKPTATFPLSTVLLLDKFI